MRKISDEFEFGLDRTTDYEVSWHFDRIIIKVSGNQDRHKSSVEFKFGSNQTTHFGVTCP